METNDVVTLSPEEVSAITPLLERLNLLQGVANQVGNAIKLSANLFVSRRKLEGSYRLSEDGKSLVNVAPCA